MTSRKYVYRMDCDRVNGWYLCIRTKSLVYYELFSLKKYGGSRQALSYAEATRDLVLAVNGR